MEELEGITKMEERRLEQLKILDVRERKTDKALNTLKSILKKSLDRENILLIEGTLQHLLHLSQALTQDTVH